MSFYRISGCCGCGFNLTSIHAKVAFSFNCLYEAVHPETKPWCQKNAIHKIKEQIWKSSLGHYSYMWCLITSQSQLGTCTEHHLFSMKAKTYFVHPQLLRLSSTCRRCGWKSRLVLTCSCTVAVHFAGSGGVSLPGQLGTHRWLLPCLPPLHWSVWLAGCSRRICNT